MKKSLCLAAIGLTILVTGCGGPKPESEAPEPQSPSSAQTTTSDTGAPATPAPAGEPQTLRLGKITGELPGDWTKGTPASSFRLAEYTLPSAEGDSAAPLFIVFDFGPGGGGGVDANIDRWKGMFKNHSGDPKVAKTEGTGVKVTTLDQSGTYVDRPPMSTDAGTERPGYRMLAAVIEKASGDEGPYFIRLVGPEKSVTAARPGWEKFVSSLKAE